MQLDAACISYRPATAGYKITIVMMRDNIRQTAVNKYLFYTMTDKSCFMGIMNCFIMTGVS